MQEMDRMKQAKRSLYNCTLRKKISLKEKLRVWSKEAWTKRPPLEWHRSPAFFKEFKNILGTSLFNDKSPDMPIVRLQLSSAANSALPRSNNHNAPALSSRTAPK